MRVVKEMPQEAVDGTLPLSHLTFRRNRSQGQTFGLSGILLSVLSATRLESEQSSTTQSHFTEVEEQSSVAHAQDEDCLDRITENWRGQNAV